MHGESRVGFFVLFRRLIVAVFFGAVALLPFPRPAFADVLYSYGFNARGIAIGGAAAAQAHDFGVAYYNPGGGILMKQPALGFGYMKTGNWLETHNASEAELKSTEGIVLGMVLPLPFGGFLKNRIALGFASFMPRDVFAELDVPYPDVPQYVLLRNSGRQATTIPDSPP